MAYAISNKPISIVFLLIETDHARDLKVFENLNVVLGRVAPSLMPIHIVKRPHKCNELPRNDPVEISVLDSLVLLVFLDVEGLKVVPSKLDCILESLEALQKGALVEAVAFGGISVSLEERVVGLQNLICLLRRTLEDNDHEAAHKESTVDHLVWLLGCAVMEDTILLVVLVSEQSCELPGVPMDHGEVQRTEVLVEWHVSKVIIDVEEEGIFVVLGRLVVRNPVQLVYGKKLVFQRKFMK